MREGNKEKKRERKIASRETVVPITINCLTKKKRLYQSTIIDRTPRTRTRLNNQFSTYGRQMIRRFLPPSHSLLPHTKRSFFFTGGGMGTEVELACQSSENYRNFILRRITKASKRRSTTPQTPRTNSPH